VSKNNPAEAGSMDKRMHEIEVWNYENME